MNLHRPELFMVFDVESIGVHGEGFAVAFVVVDRSGSVRDEGLFACPTDRANGDDEGRAWVAENVKLNPDDVVECDDPKDVRSEFWAYWCKWKEQGAVMAAECSWPVEARFLIACIDDHPASRYWGGPYPLHDIASVRIAAGFDPLTTVDRLPNELPAHDPLCDARQSARLLIEALSKTENHPSNKNAKSMTYDEAIRFFLDHGNVGRSEADLKSTEPDIGQFYDACMYAMGFKGRTVAEARDALVAIVNHYRPPPEPISEPPTT
jgi:hypothetical protein